MKDELKNLSGVLAGAFSAMERAREQQEFRPRLREYGTVIYIGQCVARIQGLPGVQSEEIVEFPSGHVLSGSAKAGFAVEKRPRR